MRRTQGKLLTFGRRLRLTSAFSLLTTAFFAATVSSAFAQSSADQTLPTDPASPVVPQQIRYSGKLPSHPGETVEAVFRIYAAPEGGEPLWTEAQSVFVAEDGSFSVLLGSATSAGLPQSVFAAGAARWLAIAVDQNELTARVPLSSVPYAMESADAQSLAGHHASDFVTHSQLAQAQQAQLSQMEQLLQSFAQAASFVPSPNPSSEIQPLTSGPVDGSGTTGTIPLWTSSSTIGNSEIVQTTTGIGINQPTPAAMLDVGGSENVNGILYLPPLATATTVAGQRSQLLQLSSSAFSNATHSPVTSTFKILANYLGNDTTSPGSQLEFHYQPTATSASLNVLTIAGTGVITFAPTQSFPGTINSISAASPITAVTTAGATTIALDQSTLVNNITPAISSNLSGAYAQLGATNTFTQQQFIQVPAILNENAFEALDMGPGVAIVGLGSQSAGAIGVLGAPNAASGLSNSFDLLNYDDGFNPGVWADAPNNPNDTNSAALIATADNSYAGIFYNDSSTISTITVLNNGGGSTGNAVGLSNVMRIGGPSGTCGFNQSGSLSCTGQVKSIVPSKDGAHLLETYSVQSSENWMEDYGSAQLNHGSATVAIESAFANTVNTGVEYHVFLTPGGDCKGLYVTNKTPTTFEVHELGGGLASIPFDYKIVAKRTGLESQRLVDVTDRMKLETEAARLKPLGNSLPRNRRLPAPAIPAHAEILAPAKP